MNDYRRAKRRKVAQTIEVTDTMTDMVVGRIGNLSETGLLLIANQPLMDDALYQLRFILSEPNGRERQIEAGAHQLWSDGANAPGQFWSGFRFIDVAPDDMDFLRAWVESPGGQYA